MIKTKYLCLFFFIFLLNSCITLTGDEEGIVIYENKKTILSVSEEIMRSEMKRKKLNKIIVPPNSKNPRLRFEKRASIHCKKYGKIAKIKSIQPENKQGDFIITKYHEEYFCISNR